MHPYPSNDSGRPVPFGGKTVTRVVVTLQLHVKFVERFQVTPGTCLLLNRKTLILKTSQDFYLLHPAIASAQTLYRVQNQVSSMLGRYGFLVRHICSARSLRCWARCLTILWRTRGLPAEQEFGEPHHGLGIAFAVGEQSTCKLFLALSRRAGRDGLGKCHLCSPAVLNLSESSVIQLRGNGWQAPP